MLSRLKDWFRNSGIKYLLVGHDSDKYRTKMMDSINPMVKVIEDPDYPLARIYRDSVFQGIIDTFDVLVGNHYDFDNDGKGRKGVLDVLILPLISRRIFGEFIALLAWNPEEPKMTFSKGLLLLGLEIAVIPAAVIEIARIALGIALTALLTPVVIGGHCVTYFKAHALKNKIQELQVIDVTTQSYNTQAIQQSLAEWMKNNRVTNVNQLEYIREEPGHFRKKTRSCLFPNARLLDDKFKLAPDANTPDVLAAYEKLNLGKHVRMR
jgi:hypothetical protein